MNQLEGSPTFVRREPPPAYQPMDTSIPPYPNPALQPGVAHPTGNVVLLTYARPTVIIANSALPPEAVRLRCPSCQDNIVTHVTHSAGTKTHLWALVLCLIGCWPCAIAPYCVDDCQNANHYCPSCGTYLGTSA